MRLCRFGPVGQEKPAVLWPIAGSFARLDISTFGEDFTEAFFATDGIIRLTAWLLKHADSCPRVDNSARIAPPFCRPSKIICVGLNYREHAHETKSEVPEEPMIFGKATTAICGSNDPIILPPGGIKTDWEVELAVVIGKTARNVSESEWLEHVAGYCVMNDISERAFQKERGGQFIKGKSADSFAPFGPYVVTKDEVPDPNSLRLRLSVNDVVRQDGSTRDMIFKVPFLISYISQFMTLLPGDVISTGTPSGVGAGMNPPQFLQPGDMLRYSVEGLGECCHVVGTYRA